jgi:hypothetical protein
LLLWSDHDVAKEESIVLIRWSDEIALREGDTKYLIEEFLDFVELFRSEFAGMEVLDFTVDVVRAPPPSREITWEMRTYRPKSFSFAASAPAGTGKGVSSTVAMGSCAVDWFKYEWVARACRKVTFWTWAL